jgi:DNA-binding transcriptional LysR family regulator
VVVAGAAVISLVIAPAIAGLAKSFPGISVHILEDLGDEVTRRVVTGEADFGIASFVRPSSDINSYLLLKDRIGILCARDHILARKRVLRPKDLTQHPLAVLGQGSVLRTVLAENPDVALVLPRPSCEASSMSALVSLVEHGAGIALLPSLAAFPATDRKLVFRPIHEPAMFRELFFVSQRRRSLTPAAQQVASAILTTLEAGVRTHGLEASTSVADLAATRRKIEAASHHDGGPA